MSDDKKINIEIGTRADTSGADAAEAALKRVGEAGKAAAEENPMMRGKAEYDARIAAERAAAEAIEAQAAAMAKAAEAGKELEEGLGKIEEEINGISEAAEEANEQGSELDENVEKIARVQKAQAVADLADKVGLIGDKFKDAANEVREFDEEAADRLDATGDRIHAVTGAVSQLAIGFALGGPLGAGVAALGIGVGVLVNAFKEAEVTAIKAAAAQKQALADSAQASRDAAAAERDRADQMTSDAIETAIRNQNAALKDGLSLLEQQLASARKQADELEQIAKAKDDLKLAEIEEAEAKGPEAGGISKEDADAQRSGVRQGAIERGRSRTKNNAAAEATLADEKAKLAEANARGLSRAAEEKEGDASDMAEQAAADRKFADERAAWEADKAKVQEKLEEARNAPTPNPFVWAGKKLAIGKLEDKRDQVFSAGDEKFGNIPSEEAEKVATESERKATAYADEAKAKRATAEAAAKEAAEAKADADRIRRESESTVRVVDEVGATQDAAKTKRESADRIRKAAQEKAAADAQAKREAEKAEREKNEIDREARSAGRDAVKALPDGLNDAFVRTVEKAAGALENGAQVGELSQLIAPLERLANAAENKANKSVVNQILTKLGHLEERMRKMN